MEALRTAKAEKIQEFSQLSMNTSYGSAADAWKAYLVDRTSADGTIEDLENKWLTGLGYTTGTLFDKWSAYTAALGYSGTVNDRVRQFFQEFLPTSIPNLASWFDTSSQGSVFSEGATQFTASDKSALQIADAAAAGLDPLTNDFSISCWIYADTVNTFQYVLGTKPSAGYPGYGLILDSTKVVWRLADTTGTTLTATSTTALSASTWYHLAVTYNRDGVATLYINGVADATTLDISSQQGSINNTGAFVIGASTTSSNYFNGRIDEVAIWMKVLSSTELSWLYNSGLGRIYSDTTAVGTPSTILTSLVSWWGLGENSGIRYDLHGNNNLSQTFANIVQPAVYGTETVTNGTLEGTYTSGVAASWSKYESAGTHTFAEEGTIVHGGSKSQKITLSGANSVGIQQSNTTTAGVTYRISAWAYIVPVDTNSRSFTLYHAYLAGDSTGLTVTSADFNKWVQITWEATADTTGSTPLFVYLGYNGTSASGDVIYLDDISMKPVTTASLNNGGFEDWTSAQSIGAEKLTNGGFETRTGITGASFASGDKANLETAADEAALDLGTGDFVINVNVLRTTTGQQRICGKRVDSDNLWYLECNGTDYVYFAAKVAGTTIIELTASTTALSSSSTKYHIQVVVDRSNVSNCKIYVNGVSQSFSTATLLDDTTNLDNNGKFYVGQSGSALGYWNGRIAMLGIGKPADVTDAAVVTALANVDGTGGLGQYYSEQSSDDKTALAWSAWWDLTETSGNRTDKVSSLVLAEAFGEIVANGTFTEADATSPPTGWTNKTASEWDTCAVASNACHLVQNGDSDPTNSIMYQQLAITSGRSYAISYAATKNSGTSLTANYASTTGTVGAGSPYFAVHLDSATVSASTFTATASNGYLMFLSANTSADDWTVDGVSVKATSIPKTTDTDLFGTWTENQPAGSTIARVDAAAEIHGGVAAVKFTRTTASCSLYVSVAVTASAAYRLSFYTRGDGTNPGKYYVYDLSNAAVITGIVSTGVTSTDYTLVNVDFMAPAGCTSVEVAILSSSVDGSTVYFDDVSLKQLVSANAAIWSETPAAGVIAREDSAPYSGTNALRFDVDAGATLCRVYLNSIVTNGKLYTLSLYAKASSATGNPTFYYEMGGATASSSTALTTSYALHTYTKRSDGTSLYLERGANCASKSVYIDSVTLIANEILAAPGISRSVSTDANFAAQLNGTSQYFSYTGTSFNPGTGDFSIGCAFYLDSIPSVAGCALFTAGQAGSGVPYFIGLINPNGKLQLNFNDSTGTHIGTASATSLSVGNWYTLVVNYDRDGNITGYINGSSFHTVDISAETGDCSPGKLFWGSLTVSPSYFLPGRIDNAFYANRLLTADEIAFMHNDGKWRQWAELGIAGTDGSALTSSVIRGFYEFDNSSALGTDATGNGNTLTNNGTATRGQGINYLAGSVSRIENRTSTIHATQTTLSKRPAYITNVQNGQPGAYFDGSDDLLTTTDISTASAGTVFIVAVPTVVAATTQYMFSSSDEATAVNYWAIGLVNGKLVSVQKNNDTSDYMTGSTTCTVNTPYIYTVQSTGTAYSLRVNGAAETITATEGSNNGDWWGDTAGRDNFAIGALKRSSEQYGFNGYILQVVVYSRSLTTTEVSAVERYLATKYGITI